MVLPFGMDLLLFGDLPSGAGLSSSASLEVLIGFIMRDLYGFDVTNVDLALIGQQAEHEFCGVNCGIMDPVSYTHLDVYKRQADECEESEEVIWKIIRENDWNV